MLKNSILIAIPNNYGYFQKEFLISLYGMQQHFYEWCIASKREDTLSIMIQGGYALDTMRNHLVEYALKGDFTHVLFLDTDMSFPPQTIVTLLKDIEFNKDKGIEAATGLYTRKTPPYLPHVYPKYNKKNKKFNICAQFPMNELFKVEGAGCGCLMVKRDVFKRVKDGIWFKFTESNYDKKKYKIHKDGADIPLKIGEDLFFCLRCKPFMVCDSGIICQHYRLTPFDINDYIRYNKFKKTKKGFKASTAKTIMKVGDKFAGILKAEGK